MDHGNIIEQGSHEELLKKNGAYAALYYSQFGINKMIRTTTVRIILFILPFAC